jgi:hypothetical protein
MKFVPAKGQILVLSHFLIVLCDATAINAAYDVANFAVLQCEV